jgi:heme-binding NEAT domain protein
MSEFFYKVTLNLIYQLLKTNYGNKYISMVINQYSKWVEAQIVANHGALVIVQLLVGSHN